jgi:hypothetical protein
MACASSHASRVSLGFPLVGPGIGVEHTEPPVLQGFLGLRSQDPCAGSTP